MPTQRVAANHQTYSLYICISFFTIYRFLVGRVIPDSKKESCVNHELLRNCNPVSAGEPDTYPEMKTNAFAS